MIFVVLFILGSVAVSLTVLLYPTPPDRARAGLLRTSWALWCLQPALLFGALLVSLAIREALGYSSSDVPTDVDAWLTLVTIAPVGIGLLAGTVVGGFAWRSERLDQPPTTRRWWALAAMLANAIWFTGGAWLMVAPVVAIGLDVVALVLVLALLLWPRRAEVSAPATPELPTVDPTPAAPDEHLVG